MNFPPNDVMRFVSQCSVGTDWCKVINLPKWAHLLSIEGCSAGGAIVSDCFEFQFERSEDGINVHLPLSGRFRMSLQCSFERKHVVLVIGRIQQW